MKYTWEKEDICPGRQVKHFTGNIYTIVSVDGKDKTNKGFALLMDNRVTPTYTADEMVQLFNDQACVPLSL